VRKEDIYVKTDEINFLFKLNINHAATLT
jgi:hypothetical protein